MVFFVGDLLGDPKSGGMTLFEVVDTVAQVCKEAKIVPSAISSHKQAQLLVIRGTEEDIKFVQSTLAALRDQSAPQKKCFFQPLPLSTLRKWVLLSATNLL